MIFQMHCPVSHQYHSDFMLSYLYFVPQMLMSAKAMSAAMFHLKPYFQSGEIKSKGTFISGPYGGTFMTLERTWYP